MPLLVTCRLRAGVQSLTRSVPADWRAYANDTPPWHRLHDLADRTARTAPDAPLSC